MIVYGDAERIEPAAAVRTSALRLVAQAAARPLGLARHAALVGAFIRAGELVQGLADRACAASGADRVGADEAAGALVLLRLAEAVDRSWRSGFAAPLVPEEIERLLARLDGDGLVRTRLCEGYAHYALYPESYLEAARRSGLGPRTCVVGIRSIGLGLAALVAAAFGAKPAISLRPTGHPFARRICADPALIADAAAAGATPFAVVDEGPGLSGSSFAAVARWLIDHGVARDRIHFFPSHAGAPGAAASAEVRALWAGIARHDARPDDIIEHPRLGLAAWLGDLIGPIDGLEEITAGGWPGAAAAAPTDTRFARRKFLARAGGEAWLVKFAGLGATGEEKRDDAVLLAEAGFAPPVAGLRYGFLVQKWLPGRPAEPTTDRAAFLRRLGAYLAFRARHMPADAAGAAPERLGEMAAHNAAEALGAAAGAGVDRLLARLGRAGHPGRPVRIDGRLHLWEWIAAGDRPAAGNRLPAGDRLVKADAVDHCRSHDLIGCQDIAWDVAGAVVELGLTDAERDGLVRVMAAYGAPPVEQSLIAALLPCYLAFQAGLWSTATAATGAGRRAQAARARCYAARLGRLLDGA